MSLRNGKTKLKCACLSCSWTGERVNPVNKSPCPSCGGKVTLMMYLPYADTFIRLPACQTCRHWERNEKFPNRYGRCRSHNVRLGETHEDFMCCEWKP
jgi:Zn finger protein HypA/HybF involved in hydrogenase expression